MIKRRLAHYDTILQISSDNIKRFQVSVLDKILN